MSIFFDDAQADARAELEILLRELRAGWTESVLIGGRWTQVPDRTSPLSNRGREHGDPALVAEYDRLCALREEQREAALRRESAGWRLGERQSKT